ncbi:exodeoxyribonuclease VII large subunit, partial [Rhodocyclus purpureus]|uniref:exodeoxyribonuclease VII large subunit n=1 Tax=Rhodocyclus purpureus TaxID=1067 RepID=UPI001F5DA039
MPAPPPPGAAPISVSALVRLARERIESALPLCWVSGEISNLVQAASGHFYFSLKDANAQVRCVMFRQRAQLIGFRPENGLRVEARVLATIYEARGEFQLNVDSLRRNGIGDLYERFLKLKDKLEREGLFDAAGKRPLPAFPRCVGIVTSPQAAALRDVLTTLARRAPQVRIVIYPAMVQGEPAPQQLAAAIGLAGARQPIDGCELLIVCRGGGSLEDLQAFNDEGLARAIHASPLPVISGVGHETDFTIADFVADRRAPTPTAAAELAAPEAAALRARLADDAALLRRSLQRSLERSSQQLDGLARRLTHPQQRIAAQRDHLRQPVELLA